jgi:hypothetical protein
MVHAIETPAPGYYNPRKDIVKIHVNRKTHLDWIKKHNKQKQDFEASPRGRSPPVPGVGQYNPIPNMYHTF